MGLENLKSVFANLPNTPSVSPDNSSMSPTLETKGRHGDNSHPGNHSILDETELNRKTKIEFTTGLNDITKNSTDPISNINSPVSDLSKDASSYGQHSPITKIDSIFANKSIRLKGGESLIDTEIEHTFGTQGGHSDIKELSPIVFRQEDSPQTKQERIIINDEKIREREDYLFQNLGADDKLGQGSFTFDTLYNADQTAPDVADRIPIDTGRVDHLGNPILINTARAGMGALSNLDIYNSSQQGFRIGHNGSKEPYIVNDIGSSQWPLGHDRDVLPYQAALQDASRLLKFYTSGAGLAFYGKEVLTSAATAFGITRPISLISDLPEFIRAPFVIGRAFFAHPIIFNAWSPSAVLKISAAQQVENSRIFAGQFTAPPIPIPMTGFLNFYHGSLQQPGSINLRKPLARGVEYSSLVKVGALQSSEEFSKIAFLGTLQQDMHRQTEVGTPQDRVARLTNPFGRFLEPLPNDPKQRKYTPVEFRVPITDELSDIWDFKALPKKVTPPPFLGLGSNLKHSAVDKISKTGLQASKLEDAVTSKTIDPLDFYVRIKDLRNDKFIYFRGYVTGITENANPSWTSTNYIGRSEPVYMYERGERDLSFNLRLSPANKTEFEKMWEKINYLTSLVYPEYLEHNSMVRMKPPFTELYMAQFGSQAKGQFGFMKSISYTVNDSGDWEVDTRLPRLIDVAISYQILNKKPPSLYSERSATGNTISKFYNF